MVEKYNRLQLNSKELNVILDGLTDTLTRNENGELIEEDFDYISEVMVLKKKVERELSERNRTEKLVIVN